MQQLLKQTRKLALPVILATLMLGGCSKDNDEGIEPIINPTNSLVYKGQTHSLNLGGLRDYGFDGSHYNQEFHLFQLSEDDEDFVPIYLFLDLFSASEQSFRSGIFHFANYEEEDVTGKHYFDDGDLIVNMRLSSNDADEVVPVSNGTVKVAGSGDDFAVEFDLMLANGESLRGSFGGPYERIASNSNSAQSRLQSKMSKWISLKGTKKPNR